MSKVPEVPVENLLPSSTVLKYTVVLPLLLPVVCLLFVVLAVFWFTSRNSVYNSPWFGGVLCLFFITLGCYKYQITIPEFQQQHYIHTLTQQRPLVQLQIKEILKPDTYNYKYRARETHRVSFVRIDSHGGRYP